MNTSTRTALVALLRSLAPGDLVAVLQDVNAETILKASAGEKPHRKARLCGVCRETYPRCRALWSDDHEWEGPQTKAQEQARD